MPLRVPKAKQIPLIWYVLGVLLGIGVLYVLGQLQPVLSGDVG